MEPLCYDTLAKIALHFRGECAKPNLNDDQIFTGYLTLSKSRVLDKRKKVALIGAAARISAFLGRSFLTHD